MIIDTLRVMSGAKSHVQLVVGLEPSLRHIRRILCLVCDDLSFLWGIARKKAFSQRKDGLFQEDLCASVEAKMWGALLLLALYASESLADECFCSGVTTQCREATTYYWATLRQAI